MSEQNATPNYAIENVSLPTRSYGPSIDSFPFGDLAVGQSFFVPNLASGRAKPLPLAAANEASDAKFKAKRDTKDGQEGVRVFRVS